MRLFFDSVAGDFRRPGVLRRPALIFTFNFCVTFFSHFMKRYNRYLKKIVFNFPKEINRKIYSRCGTCLTPRTYNLSRATPNLAHAYLSVSSDIGLLKDRIIPCYTPDQYTHTLYLPNATRLKSQHAFEIAHVTWSAFPTQSRGI